ncbi:MAG: DNA polymerase III subunit delta, partial [Rubrobacteraceae bacterium]
EQPTGRALVKWAVGHAQKSGLDLPEDVAGFLVGRCSEDKSRIISEIEKLSLYVGDKITTPEDVEDLCPPDLQSNIFSFVDSLGNGQREQALKLLEELLATGEPPLRILYMIRRQYGLVARAKSLSGQGASSGELAKELKVPPFVVRKLEEQGRRLEEEDIDRAFELLLELEGGLKGGQDLGDELQVEIAVFKLVR